jgi:hypothetical protein
MIVWQEEMERTNSSTFVGQPTKADFARTWTVCFSLVKCVWYNFCDAVSSEIACGLEWTTERTAADHSLRDTGLYSICMPC